MPEFNFQPPEEASELIDTFIIANWSRLTPPILPHEFKYGGALILIQIHLEEMFDEECGQFHPAARGMLAAVSEQLSGEDARRMVGLMAAGFLGALTDDE